MSWRLVVTTVALVLWMLAVLVAWLVGGIIINTEAYWVFMWIPAVFTAASPFIVGAVLVTMEDDKK